MRNSKRALIGAAVCVLTTLAAAHADNWDIYLTVDNQFDVYYGTPMTTNYHAGYGNNWSTEYHYTASGRPATDYLYVATASDFSVAQGFIGTFTNTTLNTKLSTGDPGWEVFPAGQYLLQIFGTGGSWPYLTMPTQSQVDAAIAYATTNNLWVAPSTATGYDNDPSTPITPYSFIWPTPLPNVEQQADWIWYNSGRDPGSSFMPAPFNGFNHDEFLVFRVPGIAPEPGTVALLAAGAAGSLLRRRRCGTATVSDPRCGPAAGARPSRR